ncbi:hypothetical protein JDV02_003792 [Purpureocillium takamizusanense]|uniref:Vacuolar protein sorting-associated protein 51 homolog n=1 Tax=Purpureocillium takamizusanense TaxID=2060973 RepID=A0A9Q8VA59_9HYPO|nr:uncharacterized protein JDV02_003792 [Purpureocillium takamizusanense]UNI17451.1 hypothetical protein JDV02_003792 [Purpureocillium takamizusanense]
MSTIASPRESSVAPLRRLPSSGTPTSSGRPSLEAARSAVTSPVNNANPTASSAAATGTAAAASSSSSAAAAKRSNRAALREYYNLRAAAAAAAATAGATTTPTLPRIEVPDSEVPASDLDAADFNADEYVDKVVAESGLEDLLRLYAQVVGEVRALDAEKKALVYDNYSKLITATETIRKMRANMDPLNPMASTLDPAIAQIYSQASSIREAARASVPAPDTEQGQRREAEARRRRTKELAAEALAVPPRLRALAKEGKMEEARRQWELPRKLLVSWKEQGVGGDNVQALIDEGDAIVRPTREPPSARTSTASR